MLLSYIKNTITISHPSYSGVYQDDINILGLKPGKKGVETAVHVTHGIINILKYIPKYF